MSDQVGCPYQVLQVSRDANDDEIKKAYRKLAVIHHPDKNQGSVEATQMFQKIGSAYALLSDPDRRSRYDMTGSLNEDDDEEGPDMDDLMQMFFQSFGGGMMFGGAPMYFEMNGGRPRGGRKGKARQAQQQEEMFANIFGGFESYDDSDEDDDGFFDDPAYGYMDESGRVTTTSRLSFSKSSRHCFASSSWRSKPLLINLFVGRIDTRRINAHCVSRLCGPRMLPRCTSLRSTKP